MGQVTHRQQHAFDFPNRTEASEEGQDTNERRSHDQNVNGTGEQVRAQQLAEEVAIDECNDAQYKDNCAADLYRICGSQNQFSSILRVQRNFVLDYFPTYKNNQIANEHSVLDDLRAAIIPSTDTHFDSFTTANTIKSNFVRKINAVG